MIFDKSNPYKRFLPDLSLSAFFLALLGYLKILFAQTIEIRVHLVYNMSMRDKDVIMLLLYDIFKNANHHSFIPEEGII
jgi:hypothetical protein